MKKQTLFRKLLSSIMVAIIVLGQFSSYRFISKAAALEVEGGDGPISLSLSELNAIGEGYAFGMENNDGGTGVKIWSILSSGEYASNLYCIKAEHGNTWSNTINPSPSTEVIYNQSYTLPLTEETEWEVADNVLLGTNKNEILWLIDQLYIPLNTPEESTSKDFIKYLKNAEIIYDPENEEYAYSPADGVGYTETLGVSTNSYYQATVTPEDIVAIQQAAIWYFTNGGIYEKDGESPWLQYTTDELLADTTGMNKYPQLSSDYKARAEHATIIYNYLIDGAKAVAEELGDAEYKLQNSNAKLWVSVADDGTVNEEQPVIEVHKQPEFDLSLRKTIVEVKDSQGNIKNTVNAEGNDATRTVTVDTTPLTDESENTTADYNHRKDPVVVETGDTVTYAITIYNEGEQDGYATIIKDQLPGEWSNGLRLVSSSGTVTAQRGDEDGNTYQVTYDSETNTVVLTMVEESETYPRKVLASYNGEGTLESETVYIECKVMGNPDASISKTLTNIAYIAQDYNAETTTITDRDSKTEEYPQYPGKSLITDNIGYTGNVNNANKDLSQNVYFEGEQDDDDFEKVVILPESFDLSLRKNITKVTDTDGNKTIITDRTPVEDTANLDNGKTTAEYNHRKDAVSVKNGYTVDYNITIYNEGSTDGVASIIKDQLPTGLTFDIEQFDKEEVEDEIEYIATSTKGNKYIVTYDETNNIVTFTLKETKIANIKLLSAYSSGNELDKDEISLQCIVDCTADDNENIYLTNIAYIYTAIRYDGTENGTIVTAQKAKDNSEADRDSEPYTIPSESSEDLKTMGNVGYIGDEEANKDKGLSQNVYFQGEQDDDDFEKLVMLPEAFDLSLRKYITEVDGTEIDRTPEIDTTNLDNGKSTTAEYNHQKDPVTVENGSKVTYNISIYNEGAKDGIATIIRDQLPTGLVLNIENTEYFTKDGEKYYVTSSKGNVYEVVYNTETNLVEFKLDKTKTETLTYLQEYKAGTQKLDEETISIQCVVNYTADDTENTYFTNIAYIYTAEQIDGTVVTSQKPASGPNSDIDSKPYAYPTEENLVTVGNVGYIGHKDNASKDLSKDIYFKGQEDDDDFEKLVMLPEAFDLSLRKYITEVDGTEIDRTPEIDTTNLDNGKSTTAEYNHPKAPVVVEDGSKVTYNISIYNEGAKDGIATIIRDQLPTGLVLNLENINYFEKDGDKYYVTSSKGNVYEVVYNTETNLVEFKLDKTKTETLTYLQKYEVGTQKLDEETISIQCVVNYTADTAKNTYFTNIAYIYTAEQIDGTVVTNQKPASGPDSDIDSKPYAYPDQEELVTVGKVGYIGNGNNEDKDLSQNVYFEGEEDDDDFEKIVMLPKTFDLKLIKFITEVNGEETGNRVISVDTSKLNTNNQETTAEYILEKNPVSVKAGDFVTYTLRVYNEGDYDGYATEISEDIPDGLEFIVVADGVIYSWDGKELKNITTEIQASNIYDEIVSINSNWGYTLDSSIITTRALSEDLIKGFEQENEIDYKEVQVIFRVKENVKANTIIRNEATISVDKAVDKEGQKLEITDRDSTPGNDKNIEENEDVEKAWKKEDSEETYDEKGKWPIYEEDDEDYDNIITKSFDLSLRKQVVKVNDGTDVIYTNRYATLLEDEEAQEEAKTLYNYYNVYSNKVKVKAGDKVTYSIRVYNEGDIDGYAALIVDTLPEGLEFVKYESGDGSINDKYGWTLVEGTENVYQTDYLSYEKDTNKGTANSTILKAYDGEEVSYQEIYIECRVKADVTKSDSLLNVAQIAKDTDEKGKEINDKDSVPGISDDESKWKEEDDLDIEILELQEFDLALRKFITQIENGEEIETITTRIPQVSYDETTKQLVYTHTKDALVVHVGDTVIYTLRVYNEGDIDGYASEIKDNIPEYLEYLPEHSTNKEYEWVMYDEEGNKTDDATKAAYICTEYLAQGKGVELDEESEETNLLEAFDPEDELSKTNPSCKEVKVAFKVKDPNSTKYEIVNFAQISDDSDSKGNPIEDRDSTTNNGKGEPKEDDEDIEKVKVEYFDLSLLKYVTKVLVNENGVERIIETGNVGDENDIIPHVQMNKKNVYKTVVKFVYSIKITNEGQIAGEATEITDYIPEGLVFVAEDNELWTDEGNNVISTKQLTGSTLQPGESVEVEVVLRWINGEDNFGAKTNVAEISEDYNEENVPDRDSTPDNKQEGEDDIDEATVLLSVNQGGGIQSIYIYLTLAFLVIILVGGILIKKFVL